ncbi:MAG: AAA family ATPase, partial [Woeseiaceae bacterium]
MTQAAAIEPGATLLEREGELAELRHALNEAQQGRGRIVLVEAPAGLGKTSLLSATIESAAAAGFCCLRARASELERDFAYGCVRQLLEPVIARASDAERQHLLDGAAVLSKPLFTAGNLQASAPSADSTYSVLHGLYWLLNNLAGTTPLLLCIDDLHWADAESLRLINYLAPRLDGLPLIVLTAARTGENVTADLARLFAGPETNVLRPCPLSIRAATALCEARLGGAVAADFAAACHDATGGNPLFLKALLHDAKEQKVLTATEAAARVRRIGPTAVARAVQVRLSTAPAAASALVRAAALLGDGASIAEAARLADVQD